ncbi:MAG: hypothetical protein SLAVMIC_00475 [uncultured marine phage]|uniref:Uncharacterized protein n=1 Tax=uncultured marine phage TaxID=707152 RepID=A0A8D9CBL5_9VIRU|nr:MAG: hypothetical protein SLAVMIC_00475 [uncultured marine phage]
MKEELIECIQIGFDEMTQEIKHEDDLNYDPDPIELPIEGEEAQYAWEFGMMMAREGLKIEKSEMDNYLKDILLDSCSEHKFENL